MPCLNGTIRTGIEFFGGGNCELEGYIEASYGVHVDGRSRTGELIKFNNGIIGAWTAKQNTVVKSYTEAELVVLPDASVHILWARE